MKIVTGYTGTPHITSNDQQAFNQGIFGTGNSVLGVGQKFDATLNTATTITIEDGEGVMQGVHFRIETGETETVTISPGTSGYNRIDLICARYTKEPGTGAESVELVVVEGTPSTGTAAEPSYNTGDILSGDTPVDFPLWKVTLSGLTPTLTKAFSGGSGANGIVDMIYPVGSIYMSVNSTDPSLLFGGTWSRWGVGRVPVGVSENDANFSTVESTGGSKTIDGELHQHHMKFGEINVSGGTGYTALSLFNIGTIDLATEYVDHPDAAVSNMPPYITCYMWKRTA